ncbi:MAG: LysE family translocator [Pseudomonadales bacterium]|uniref:RhtB family transporter n=1 Tax=Oleiphilus messinensis TaxID=141451 RepID=A0A1Y0I7H1_9GAMM|nr:LysE family translocator [Oleiphilus messinensis]ARU55384.1 RhtB family transporter [Oleiphilus messinensis]MCG8612548.1 LysE family translocator [Pseudomonadales bacterium]
MEFFISILLFALVSTVTPGPNNIMVMTSGLNYGIFRSLPHLFGICLGFPAMVIAVGLGMGAIFEQFPVVHSVIKIIGILYLLYLAYRIAMTRQAGKNESQKARPFTFIEAALFQWVNPKAWVMAVGAVAAFTTVGAELFNQTLTIALAFLAVAFPCVGLWLVGGASLRKLLNDPAQLRIFNGAMAFLLVLSVIPMAL